MTLTQQKQRLLAILLICALVCILILSVIGFEVIQHMNGMWHIIASAGTNFRSRHP